MPSLSLSLSLSLLSKRLAAVISGAVRAKEDASFVVQAVEAEAEAEDARERARGRGSALGKYYQKLAMLTEPSLLFVCSLVL